MEETTKTTAFEQAKKAGKQLADAQKAREAISGALAAARAELEGLGQAAHAPGTGALKKELTELLTSRALGEEVEEATIKTLERKIGEMEAAARKAQSTAATRRKRLQTTIDGLLDREDALAEQEEHAFKGLKALVVEAIKERADEIGAKYVAKVDEVAGLIRSLLGLDRLLESMDIPQPRRIKYAAFGRPFAAFLPGFVLPSVEGYIHRHGEDLGVLVTNDVTASIAASMQDQRYALEFFGLPITAAQAWTPARRKASSGLWADPKPEQPAAEPPMPEESAERTDASRVIELESVRYQAETEYDPYAAEAG